MKAENNCADLIKKYFAAWEQKNWPALDALLAGDFTFSSPNHDDHISKSVYKERCWAGADIIDRFDIDQVIEQGDQAVAVVRSYWKNGTTFRTAELFTIRDGQIKDIDSFWDFMPQDIPAMKEALAS